MLLAIIYGFLRIVRKQNIDGINEIALKFLSLIYFMNLLAVFGIGYMFLVSRQVIEYNKFFFLTISAVLFVIVVTMTKRYYSKRVDEIVNRFNERVIIPAWMIILLFFIIFLGTPLVFALVINLFRWQLYGN